MEETNEFEQTATEEPKSEEPEIEDLKTEEAENPETNEHDVPPALDNPDLNVVDRVVIVEVVKEDDKKETHIQSDEVSESIPFSEDGSFVGTDIEEDLSSESDENTESETQSESEAEESSVDVMSDISGSSSDVLESETESETEAASETETIILMNNDVDASVEYLHSIDLKLSCIIFILLFTVCERKLRYGVRALCGRVKND